MMKTPAEIDRSDPPASCRHAERVQEFFGEPDRYLSNDVRLRIRLLLCQQMLEGTDRSLMLDIGCGDGSISLPLVAPRSRLTLLDFSAPMLERARQNIPGDLRSRVEVVCQDLTEFSTAEPYSLVICLGVLAHVPDVGGALARIASLLRPGGHCLLQITDASRWLGRLNYAYYDRRSRARPEDGYRLNRLTSGRIAADAGALGLRLVDCRNYSLAFPGLRRLPDGLQFRLERAFLKSRLSRHGGESLLLFRRGEP
jgi:SAM-dependent methyltransferase